MRAGPVHVRVVGKRVEVVPTVDIAEFGGGGVRAHLGNTTISEPELPIRRNSRSTRVKGGGSFPW